MPMPTPSTIPPSNAEIEAETTHRWTRQSIWFPGVEKLVEDVKAAIEACGTEADYAKPVQLRGAQALAALHVIYPFANAKAKHFEDHFYKLAKESPRANQALSRAKEDWQRIKGEEA